MSDPRITYTPNLKLSKLPPNFHVWAQIMNDNLTMVDAAISGFIVYQNMRGPWTNSTAYELGDAVVDMLTGVAWQCQIAHTSPVIPTTFLEDRTANPTRWTTYSPAATARGVWTGPGTAYTLNDFVVADGVKYAVCIAAHVSGPTFAGDVALGYWSVLVDLSTAGSLVLPVLSGAPDANKFVITDSNGVVYAIYNGDEALLRLGATSIGTSVLRAISQAAARVAIDAAQATDTTTQLPGNNTTKYASTAFVAEAASHYYPLTTSIMQLYSETVLAAPSAAFSITVPTSYKLCEIWFAMLNTGSVNDPSGLILNDMQGASVNVTLSHDQQSVYGTGATAGAATVGAQNGWNMGAAQRYFAGVLRLHPPIFYSVQLTTDYVCTNSGGAIIKLQASFTGGSPGVTGFRFNNGGGTTMIAGSYARCFYIA